MATVATKPLKERRPGPYAAGRRCTCGAELSRNNPGSLCAPCNGGSWPGDKRVSLKEGSDLLEELMAG